MLVITELSQRCTETRMRSGLGSWCFFRTRNHFLL